MKNKADLMNPFPGLRSFRSDEDYLFFGREEQTLELVTRLQRNRFIAVVGTSGRGKSSLVRCGLLSRLQGGGMVEAGAHWEIAVMHPGGDPLRHLATALLDAGLHDREAEDALPHLLATLGRSQFGLIEAVRQAAIPAKTNFLLVVDQFEEIFRYDEAGKTESEVANDFIAMLREASAQTEVPIYIVTTMRSDFIGDCSRFEGLAEAVNRGEYLIPGLNRDQFKAAIEGPIRVAGGQLAPRLLQRLLNDLGEEQDQLPCLQHALMRTWRVWQARADAPALDLEDYAQVGKMSQALSVHADEVFSGLATDRQRELGSAMFKALTVEGSEKRGIRRPRRLQTLCGILGVEPAELTPIIDAFRHPEVSFLMPPSDVPLRDTTVIDLSHESLMRVWTRLRDWVDDEAKSVGIFRRLSESAALWRQGKSGFYRDPELSIARAWVDASRPNPVWAEQYDGNFEGAMAFLQASNDAAQEEVRAQEAARQRELAQARALAETERSRAEEQTRFSGRLKWLLRGVGAVALVALAALVFALAARREAQENAKVANASEKKAASAQSLAEKARTLTDTARGQAEKLATFLLDDFYEDLATTAGLEMIGALAERAVAYYDGLPPELRTAETQQNRTLAQLRRGIAITAEGDFERGRPIIEEALAEFDRIHGAGDTSDAAVVGLALALEAASVSRLSGPSERSRLLLRATGLLRPLAQRPNASPQMRLRFARILSGLPHVFENQGEGTPRLEEARAILVQMGALDLSNLSAASSYANVLVELGKIAKNGETRVARTKEGLAVAVKVIAQRPGDLGAVRIRAVALGQLADAARRRYDEVERLNLLQQADRAYEHLVRLDPGRISFRDDLMQARINVALALSSRGRIADAVETARSVAVIALEQRANAAALTGLVAAHRNLARLLAACGDIAAAEEAFAEWTRLFEQLVVARLFTPTNPTALRHNIQSVATAQFIKLAGGNYEGVIADLAPLRTRIAATDRGIGRTSLNRNLVTQRREQDRLWLEAIRQAAVSHICLGRYQQAEAVMLDAAKTRWKEFADEGFDEDSLKSLLWSTWLARAIVEQGRNAEAAAIIDGVVLGRRQEQKEGADDVPFRINLSHALLVQALAQSADSAGREKVRALLDEADRLLRGMTDEAQKNWEAKLLTRDIATARTKLGVR